MNYSFLGDKLSSGPQWLFLHSSHLVIIHHCFFFMSFQLHFHFHHLSSLCLYCSTYATYSNLSSGFSRQHSSSPLCTPSTLHKFLQHTSHLVKHFPVCISKTVLSSNFPQLKDFYDPLLLTGGGPISSNYKGPLTNSNNSLEYKPPNSPDYFILSPKHALHHFFMSLHFVSSAMMLSSPLSISTLCSLQGITGSNFFSKLSLFTNYMLLIL